MGATTIDQAALDEVLYSHSGPVMRWLYDQSEVIKHVAAEKINRSDGPGPHMKDHGIVEDTTIAGRPGFLIGFESEHAGWYYFGTQPHRIEARNARALAFKWPKVGPGVFHFRSVQHPGTDPHPFLHETVMEMFGVLLP